MIPDLTEKIYEKTVKIHPYLKRSNLETDLYVLFQAWYENFKVSVQIKKKSVLHIFNCLRDNQSNNVIDGPCRLITYINYEVKNKQYNAALNSV